jgi:hypothetical protein
MVPELLSSNGMDCYPGHPACPIADLAQVCIYRSRAHDDIYLGASLPHCYFKFPPTLFP